MSELFQHGVGVTDLGIQCVHLMTGEDVVGHVFKTEDGYRIEEPVVPMVQQDPSNGQFRVGLLPVRPYLQGLKGIDVRDGHVVFLAPVDKRMEDMHRQMFSNIVVASPSNLQAMLNPTKK